MNDSAHPEPLRLEFAGTAPFFPLPNVVLFPHAVLPLHIFEPRYRQMTADILAGERYLAMALMQAGWERVGPDYPPPVHPVMGLGRVVHHELLSDGRYHLSLGGIARVRLIEETTTDTPYRTGRFETLADVVEPGTEDQLETTLDELIIRMERVFPDRPLRKILQVAEENNFPVAAKYDAVIAALPLVPQLSQKFLEALAVSERATLLNEMVVQLEQQSPPVTLRSFPPPFSPN